MPLSMNLWGSGFLTDPLYNDITSRSSSLPESERVQLMLLYIYRKIKQASDSVDAAKMWESFLGLLSSESAWREAVQKLSQ